MSDDDAPEQWFCRDWEVLRAYDGEEAYACDAREAVLEATSGTATTAAMSSVAYATRQCRTVTSRREGRNCKRQQRD